ncbi:unnamed protein product [Peniophora sp. CBMAI 1063]|nr:unnamed protein product [Peniophora sp. CBMAI 1063]
MFFSITVSLALLIPTYAAPYVSLYRRLDASALRQNGLDAQAQNQNFTSLTADSSCTEGTNACVNNAFAQCVGGSFVLQPCSGGEICAALPLVNSAGTSITCTTTADRDARIQSALGSDSSSSGATTAAGSSATSAATSSSAAAASTSTSKSPGSNNSGDLQTSMTLDASLVGSNLAKDGTTASGGETPSLTSTNNFINFCANFTSTPITNGQQVKTGSCNPVPMGQIAANSNMPQCKFVHPVNMGTVKANQDFTVTMAIKNLDTGFFTNPDTNYYSAPQQINADTGNIRGHSHFVIEALDAINQTTPLDNTKFAYFAGVNSPAVDGKLNVTVSGGLPKGAYRLASINSAMNHQPVLVAEAQRGAVDDMIYFTAV